MAAPPVCDFARLVVAPRRAKLPSRGITPSAHSTKRRSQVVTKSMVASRTRGPRSRQSRIFATTNRGDSLRTAPHPPNGSNDKTGETARWRGSHHGNVPRSRSMAPKFLDRTMGRASSVTVEMPFESCVRCAMDIEAIDPIHTARGGGPRETPKLSDEWNVEPMWRFTGQTVDATGSKRL